jgi:hypothetical protein
MEEVQRYLLPMPGYGGNPTLSSAVVRIRRKSRTFYCCQDKAEIPYLLLFPGNGGKPKPILGEREE